MQNWDDLRFFLAVARSGSLTAAAAKLDVNQSTVSRRIASFELELKVRLFERFPTGYVLTPEGEELLLRAQHIEEEAHAIERHVMGKNVELSGPIRVTCSLVIAQYFLIPLLPAFSQMYPGIVIHLHTANSLYNLSSREADVAIRVTRDAVPETLIGRELGHIQYGVYGRKDYVTAYRRSKGKQPLFWIGEDSHHDRPDWLPPTVDPLRLVMSSNDVLPTFDLLKQGLGVGRLPRFMGDRESTLRRLETGHVIPAVPIWLLTHADIRKVNRISVFTTYIADEFRKQRDNFAPG